MNALINGGKEVSVILGDGSTATWRVRQLPVGEFEKGFKVWEKEIELTALLCDKSLAEVCSVHPDSYEKLRSEAEGVNASFFAFCDRQQKAIFARFNLMKSKSESPSTTLLPASLPRPV